MQFLILFVDKVHYRSQPFGTDNLGLVYDSVSMARIGHVMSLGVWTPMPVTLHIKPWNMEEVCDSLIQL